MRAAFALRMISGKNIYNFAILENLRIFQNCRFTGGGGTNSLSQSLMALTAPSGREPLARPEALHLSLKLCRHAQGPILEDDFPRPGEDVAQRQKGESVAVGDWGSFSLRAPSQSPAVTALPKGEPRAPPEAFSFLLTR